MPSVSEKQHNAMEAAAHGHSTLGIPKSVGQEFVNADKHRKDSETVHPEQNALDSAASECAGILIRQWGKGDDKGQRYLLLKHAEEGQWVQPGGHIEPGESHLQAALRELAEETGIKLDGAMMLRDSSANGVNFRCYLADVRPEDHKVTISDESSDMGWFGPHELPKDIHPEVAKTIELVSGNELDIAKAIRDGHLASPQHYENIYLFDVRFTGTGVSFRPAYDEGVYRPPEVSLDDEFLERLNGLPIIFDHPEGGKILNSEEFRNRIIGTMFVPYIKGDEVWGIAKVFDDDAAACMCETHQSTSPAVVFRNAGSTKTVELSDGSTALIEGEPSYVDHLAVCAAGVWDKGGEPNGVNNSGVSQVDQEDKAPAWADALHAKLDACVSRMDEAYSRLDALEHKGGDKDADKEERADEVGELCDSEEEVMDSKEEAEKDGKAEEKDEEKAEKAVKAAEKEGKKEEKAERADSLKMSTLEREVAALKAQLAGVTRGPTHEDRDALSAAQKRADGLFAQFGMEAPAPMIGESPISYRKRLAAKIQKYSEAVKDLRMDSLDSVSFGVIEEKVYADAAVAARMPSNRPTGHVITRTEDFGGHKVIHTEGDFSWMDPFKDVAKRGHINKTHGVH